jgi:hypothetical protein
VLSAEDDGAVSSRSSGDEALVARLVSLMCEVARVIRRRMGEDGSRFLNVGMCDLVTWIS